MWHLIGSVSLCLALSTVLAAGAASATFTPGNQTRTMTFDGDSRAYDVHVPPSYDGSEAVPLVLDFHGLGSTKEQQRAISGFQALSDTVGFIVVYPQGLFNSWNAGICCGQAAAEGVDDVGFVRAVVNAVAAEGNIDRRRVYATGLSNGGAMTQRLACEAADVFAAAAPMAFPIPFVPITVCQPVRPIAVLMFMGLTDQLVPYSSAAPSFDHWRDLDGCGSGPPDEHVVTGASFCDTYTGCTDGLEAGLCSITSTSPAPFEGHILYLNNDLNLSHVAWDFLSQFELPILLDHYKCYQAKDLKQPKFQTTTVTLADEFSINDGAFNVSKPAYVCNPVDNNGSGIRDAADHLTCYKISGPKLAKASRPIVQIADELGTLELNAVKPALLCAPSSKTVLP